MPIRYYPALICENGSQTGYDVVFSDFPGCISFGETMQSAAEAAAEALVLHVEGMVADGEALPPPSAPGFVPDWLSDGIGKATTNVLVPVELPGRSVRANITVDEALLSRIDAAAAQDGNTRSGWLAQAARERLSQRS